MNKYLKLLRVKHYIKNLLIFVPLVFARVFDITNIVNTIIAFMAFNFLASFVYIFNDIKDVEKDRLHPTKKYRPIASGIISIPKAIIIGLICLVLSLVLNYFAIGFTYSYLFLLSYLIINILYSIGLKNIVIIDSFIIALGFIIRVYYGASIITVEVSNWLFLTLLSGSLFLAFGKRKNEMQYGSDKSRKVLKYYNLDFLNSFIYVFVTLVIIFYSLWANEQNIKYLNFTIPFVVFIAMQYVLIISDKESDGDPVNVILSNKLLVATILIFGISLLTLLII